VERYPDSVHKIFDRIEVLTNLVYLTKHEAANQEKVLMYMSMADETLKSFVDLVKQIHSGSASL
jgi:hypothetical protein